MFYWPIELYFLACQLQLEHRSQIKRLTTPKKEEKKKEKKQNKITLINLFLILKDSEQYLE